MNTADMDNIYPAYRGLAAVAKCMNTTDMDNIYHSAAVPTTGRNI